MLLELLAAQFDVLCHDQRGLGASEVPAGPYSMSDYAADAVAVADWAGWERFSVLGISFGGMVALELGTLVPDRIVRLALWCTSPGGAHPSYPLREIEDLEAEQRLPRYLSILDRRFNPWWFLGHPRDRALASMLRDRPSLADERHRGAMLQLDARSAHDVSGRLRELACETTVFAGRFDGIAPPENVEAIAVEIPQADIRFYDGGHLFFLQDPAAFPDTMSFLRRD